VIDAIGSDTIGIVGKKGKKRTTKPKQPNNQTPLIRKSKSSI
jgi:hypothetical protein